MASAHRLLRWPVLLVIALGTQASLAERAAATFPGKNGRILFVGERKGSHTVNPDGSGLRPTGKFGALSPDGETALVGSGGTIRLLDLSSGEATAITRKVDGKLPYDGSPAFLGPAGDRIIFDSARDGGGVGKDQTIWSIGADGTALEQLTEAGKARITDGSPTSSPDGSLIAFDRYEYTKKGSGKARHQIYVMTADGTHLRRVTFTGRSSATDPCFSPDGHRILFTGFHRRRSYLASVSVHGGPVRRTTSNRGLEFAAGCYSPNGKRILAIGARPGVSYSGSVYTMDLEGDNQRRITPERFGSVDYAVWAPR